MGDKMIKTKCSECIGFGKIANVLDRDGNVEIKDCPSCNGQGVIEEKMMKTRQIMTTKSEEKCICPGCSGDRNTHEISTSDNSIQSKPCSLCKGKGVTLKKSLITYESIE